MPKSISLQQGFRSVLFWSIISAAFIGPGTVTTAAKAGASFQLQLLWALVFSIFATIILQEAAARITIASGKNLGEIIAQKYATKNRQLRLFLFLAVAIGCAAYQAGNMLGAVAGIELLGDVPKKILTLSIGVVCFAMLWIGSFRMIANVLGLVVAFMGVAFLYVAVQTDIALGAVAIATVSPTLPAEGLLLTIGLIGTTIVPYNLFLASGISQGQEIQEMRVGIITAVLIGGLISIGILVVGTQVAGTFSFTALAEALKTQLGENAQLLLGFGLFAAGLTSSITSPLAAAVTAKSLLGNQEKKWQVQGQNFRLVWFIILLVGLTFGLLEVKPIPAIILAQALNGILLPVVAIFLFLTVNDAKLLSKRYTNTPIINILFLVIVGITCFLGLNNIVNALAKIVPAIGSLPILSINAALSVVVVVYLGIKLRKDRSV
jgi:manganese transport protein